MKKLMITISLVVLTVFALACGSNDVADSKVIKSAPAETT